MADVSATLDTADRAREADDPHSHVVQFGVDRPLKLDAGLLLAPFPIAFQPSAALNSARRNSVVGRNALTGDRRRQPSSGDRKIRLVGDHGGTWPADRHRALFRHLPERGRRLHGHHRTGLHQSEDRPALGPRVSDDHHPRHGACPEPCCSIISASARSSRSPAARWAACRSCNGRRAIPSACSRLLPLACADAPLRAEHRVSRGRPPGGDGRSGMARRPLFRHRHQSAARIGGVRT